MKLGQLKVKTFLEIPYFHSKMVKNEQFLVNVRLFFLLPAISRLLGDATKLFGGYGFDFNKKPFTVSEHECRKLTSKYTCIVNEFSAYSPCNMEVNV